MGCKTNVTTGAIEDLALAEIVQVLSLGGKTARVRVDSPFGSGRIWFVDGRAVHAEQDALRGTEAFHRVLQWSEGRFVIEHGVTGRRSSIDEDTMLIVMESLRRRDESTAERQATDRPATIDPLVTRVYYAAMTAVAVIVAVSIWVTVDTLSERDDESSVLPSTSEPRVSRTYQLPDAEPAGAVSQPSTTTPEVDPHDAEDTEEGWVVR